jgi:hypothetical protein
MLGFTAGDSTMYYEDESSLRRQIMSYARSYSYCFTHIKGMINFVNLSKLNANDESAGESASVMIMCKSIPARWVCPDLGMVNFVTSYDSGEVIFSYIGVLCSIYNCGKCLNYF